MISWIFKFCWLDFGVREVSQRRDLEILLQMGSGRARDDFKMPRSGTGTIPHFRRFQHFLWKPIPYASSGQATTTKMTAIGPSWYELFIKTITLDAFLWWIKQLFRKTHFLFEAFSCHFSRVFIFYVRLLAGKAFFYFLKKHDPLGLYIPPSEGL